MSVALKENLKQNLDEVFDELPVELLAEVVDFAEFLREKERRKPDGNNLQKERIAGLNQGEIWMSDDFNDELSDEFWFGEDSETVRKGDESVD